MAVKITNREYKNQFHDLSEQTDWLLGNVGDWQQLRITLEASIDFKATTSETITVDIEEKTLVLNNGKKWSDYGFDNGDPITFNITTQEGEGDNPQVQKYSVDLSIQNQYNDTIEYTGNFPSSIGSGSYPSDRGTEKYLNVSVISDKVPEGIKFQYAHLTNEDFDSDNLSSLIDGTIPEFSMPGINNFAINTVNWMNPDGFQSGGAIERCYLVPRGRNGVAYVYDIYVIFMIASFFESPSNLENMEAPSILFDAASLTDNFKIYVFPEWNNPNTVISNNLDHTERLGNTGWFDENFNGLDNNFVLEKVSFEDEDGVPMADLDYGKPTIATIEVSGIENLSNDSQFSYGFSWIPQDESDYYNKKTPYHENVMINTGGSFNNGANDSFNLNQDLGSNILEGFTSPNGSRLDAQQLEDPLFTLGGVDKVVFKIKFIPNAEFTNFFDERNENDRNYILWLSVANHDAVINFSDRVSILAKYSSMEKIVSPVGSYPGMITRFIEHPQNELVSGAEKYFGFIEDDVLSRVQFSIGPQKNCTINSMSFGYEVKNVDTGLYYSLENVSIPLDEFKKDVDGIQQISINESRGFKLEEGNNKNYLRINRDSNTSSYIAYFATKIRWEDWILRDNVPEEFFDIQKENNGENNNWLNYLRAGIAGSHKVFFVVYTEILEDGIISVYKNEHEIDFVGYDENLNIETTHEYYRDSDDTLLNVIGGDLETGKPLGVILSDQPTRIEITYTNLTEDFDFDKMYATICMEVDRGGGAFEFRQLSSHWGSESDNPLKPLAGETKLKFELVSPRVIKTSCLVDPTKLEQVLRYKISGRLGCWAESPGLEDAQGLYEALYETTYE